MLSFLDEILSLTPCFSGVELPTAQALTALAVSLTLWSAEETAEAVRSNHCLTFTPLKRGAHETRLPSKK
jgi:hypothetical protein